MASLWGSLAIGAQQPASSLLVLGHGGETDGAGSQAWGELLHARFLAPRISKVLPLLFS